MPGRATLVVLLALTGVPAVFGAEPPALARARALYNVGDFGGAAVAASEVRQIPEWADAAALITARSHIERFRVGGDIEDLATARAALGSVRAAALSPRDQVDLLIGMGQSMFFDDRFGAAAELFDAALGRAAPVTRTEREGLLEWWATALERDASRRPAERRSMVFDRLTARMQAELDTDPQNLVASYWLAAGARGAGDLDRAWGAAVAGWTRSRAVGVAGEQLRVDLDKLVREALIPERAKVRAAREQPRDTQAVSADLLAEWEMVKRQWQ